MGKHEGRRGQTLARGRADLFPAQRSRAHRSGWEKGQSTCQKHAMLTSPVLPDLFQASG